MIESEAIELRYMRFFIVYCLLSHYILERRAFRRIQDDKLGSVGRTQALRSNKFHAVAQRHFFAMLWTAFDRSPAYSVDDKWFE